MGSTTFKTKSGVKRFETGGPDGLIAIEAGKPFETSDPAVIALLNEAGQHALDSVESKPKAGEQ